MRLSFGATDPAINAIADKIKTARPAATVEAFYASGAAYKLDAELLKATPNAQDPMLLSVSIVRTNKKTLTIQGAYMARVDGAAVTLTAKALFTPDALDGVAEALSRPSVLPPVSAGLLAAMAHFEAVCAQIKRLTA